MKVLEDNKVAIIMDKKSCYPSPPFNPDTNYSEYPFKDEISTSHNPIYSMVRQLLYQYGLDKNNFGSPKWNPFGEFIKPGDFVLIKPNLVRHYHPYGLDIYSIFTNGSVIRAILDYVYIALKGNGKIIIGEAPLQSCDFETIKDLNGLNAIEEFYSKRKIEIDIIDFRLVRAYVDNSSIYGNVLKQVKLPGDPLGYTEVKLGQHSFLEPVSNYYENFRVTCYNPFEMKTHHRKGYHEYIIPNSVLKADVIINLPKMKTHHKAGITGALKNLIGINGHKDWLPHHRKGPKIKGGDEYLNYSVLKEIHTWITDKKEIIKLPLIKKSLSLFQRITYKLAKKLSKDKFFEGSWYGNDTIWRTILDLNTILLYADKNGNLKDKIQRNVFTVVDGIIAGEKDGPLAPTPKKCGILLCGRNPVTIDTVMATLMGYDWHKIPQISNAYHSKKFPLTLFGTDEIEVIYNNKQTLLTSIKGLKFFKFEPHYGWEGHIEL